MIRGTYRTKDVQLKEFNELGEKICSKCGVLIGIQRVAAWRECSGVLHPAGFNVAVDGQSIWVPSIDAGIGLLKGFSFGLEFELYRTSGRGYISKAEAVTIIHAEVRRFIGDVLKEKGAAHA